MASSTADIVAAIRCVGAVAGRRFRAREVMAVLRQVERSDSVFLREGALYLSERHEVLLRFGRSLSYTAAFAVEPGVVDPGRHKGIELLHLSEYNLLSRWSDARDDAAVTTKTRQVQPQHRNFGEFKVPSLRNVADTAPYAHDGQLGSLDDVVRHYSDLDLERLHADGEQILKPLRLSDGERADLVAFLRSLSDPGATAWQAKPLARCSVKP
jgi:hypothetical protein